MPTEWGKFPFKASMKSIQMSSLSSSAPAPEAACYSSCQDPLGKPCLLPRSGVVNNMGPRSFRGEDAGLHTRHVGLAPSSAFSWQGVLMKPSPSLRFPLQSCISAWQPRLLPSTEWSFPCLPLRAGHSFASTSASLPPSSPVGG